MTIVKSKPYLNRWPYWPLPALLTRKQTAAILGVSTRTISRAWKHGELKKVQEVGTFSAKGYRVPLTSLEDYARKNDFTLPWMKEEVA